MIKLREEHYEAARTFAGRNRSDPFAFTTAIQRMATGIAKPMDVKAGRLDDYAPADEQYIVKELKAGENGR